MKPCGKTEMWVGSHRSIFQSVVGLLPQYISIVLVVFDSQPYDASCNAWSVVESTEHILILYTIYDHYFYLGRSLLRTWISERHELKTTTIE